MCLQPAAIYASRLQPYTPPACNRTHQVTVVATSNMITLTLTLTLTRTLTLTLTKAPLTLDYTLHEYIMAGRGFVCAESGRPVRRGLHFDSRRGC